MSTSYQMIAVPESALPAVYTLLAEHTSGRSTQSPENPVVAALTSELPEEKEEEAIWVEGNGWWTPKQIYELAGMLKNQAGIEMMNLIAKNSIEGSHTTYDQLR